MNGLNFGVYMHKARARHRMTIERLSERSGISTAQISRIETSKRGTPKPLTIQKLADALGEPYEKLLEAAGYITKARPEGMGIGKASDFRTDTVVRHSINHGMGLVEMSVVVNDWIDKNPDKHVIDIKTTEKFALIIYKEATHA